MENYLEISYENNMKMLEEAYGYCGQNYTHEDIIEALKQDNDLKKQLCLIELNKVNTQDEADILVNNLTQHSGPTRETSSFKILELIKQNDLKNFFQSKPQMNIYIKAITDINPSVSRNAVEIIQYINDKQYIYEGIIKELKKILSELKGIKQTRSYTANKKNFGLYWNLEALANIADEVSSNNELIEILSDTAKSNDYTIREKTAKTAVLFFKYNNNFQSVLDLLKNDENIYVRKYLE